jgi:transposase
MPKSRSSTSNAFTAADRRRLARAMDTASTARVFRRLAAVLLVAEGRRVAESARVVHTHRRNVARWVRRYLAARDPNALADRPRAGRPRAGAVTDGQLRRVLQTDPRALGFQSATWTTPLLATYCAARFGCAVSARTMRRRLHALGYRWKRPRYRYAQRAEHLARKKGLSAAA